MSLAKDLRRIAKDRKQSIEKVYRGTMLAMGSRIIKMSPVDEGRFRGNWFTGINTENNSTDLNATSASDSTARLLSSVGELNSNEDFYFMNNLPYAKELEDGSSDQAEDGMVKVTVNDFASIVELNIRSIR